MQRSLHKCIQLDLVRVSGHFHNIFCYCASVRICIMQLGEGKRLTEMQEINGTGVG